MAKRCGGCNESKPTSEFYNNRNTKDGLQTRCKVCHNAYYAKNKERIENSRKAYYDANPGLLAKQRRTHALKKKYGLTVDAFNSLQARQCNHCAVCREWLGDDVAVDHCHKTGKVRGLLHRQCNVGMGSLRDDPVLLRAAALYLKANCS
jgi:transposase InsO family protein